MNKKNWNLWQNVKLKAYIQKPLSHVKHILNKIYLTRMLDISLIHSSENTIINIICTNFTVLLFWNCFGTEIFFGSVIIHYNENFRLKSKRKKLSFDLMNGYINKTNKCIYKQNKIKSISHIFHPERFQTHQFKTKNGEKKYCIRKIRQFFVEICFLYFCLLQYLILWPWQALYLKMITLNWLLNSTLCEVQINKTDV